MGTSKQQVITEEFQTELSKFLSLTTGEISLSMKEANEVVKNLTKTFMDMVRDVQDIRLIAAKLEDDSVNKELKQKILKSCDTYFDKVQAGTIGFQFYDKLTQRLIHTSDNIRQLKKMADEPTTLIDPAQWESLMGNIEKRYNMESDRALFHSLMDGSSVQEAVKLAAKNKSKTGEIELF